MVGKREIHVGVCVTVSLLFLTSVVSLLYINSDVSSSCSLSTLGHLWVPFSMLKLTDSQVSLPFHTELLPMAGGKYFAQVTSTLKL